VARVLTKINVLTIWYRNFHCYKGFKIWLFSPAYSPAIHRNYLSNWTWNILGTLDGIRKLSAPNLNCLYAPWNSVL